MKKKLQKKSTFWRKKTSKINFLKFLWLLFWSENRKPSSNNSTTRTSVSFRSSDPCPTAFFIFFMFVDFQTPIPPQNDTLTATGRCRLNSNAKASIPTPLRASPSRLTSVMSSREVDGVTGSELELLRITLRYFTVLVFKKPVRTPRFWKLWRKNLEKQSRKNR